MNSLNYVFCSDKRLLEINRKFLNHNYYTDIISFDLALKTGVEGEVYISTDRVRKNASTLGLPFKSEIHRVIFHGVLHLCGYKDQTKKDQLQMRQEEDCLLNLYF